VIYINRQNREDRRAVWQKPRRGQSLLLPGQGEAFVLAGNVPFNKRGRTSKIFTISPPPLGKRTKLFKNVVISTY
jgi:hypothetical protein